VLRAADGGEHPARELRVAGRRAAASRQQARERRLPRQLLGQPHPVAQAAPVRLLGEEPELDRGRDRRVRRAQGDRAPAGRVVHAGHDR